MRGGAPEGSPGITFRRAARVRCDGDVQVQADGELIGELPMTFEIVPEGLELIIP
jgi:diacylglycerol kinase family enzyme